ncbi:hypothetical protein LSH36_234g00087 [Paralvinella palmiformis]|uniref:ShKT domain-containing protein n=1 Tax=Paralvinella palmiformis TaxID=53620 RepID=A0AAD9JMW8_9ANNE|nr:hypothetical protein LSH36_234g00087 [Paralvinella palmiformis]
MEASRIKITANVAVDQAGIRLTVLVKVCENKDYKCGHLPGWPKTWCAAKEITATCPVMCDVCEPAGDETTETPTEAPTTQPTTTQPPTTQPPTTEPTTEQTTPEDDEC